MPELRSGLTVPVSELAWSDKLPVRSCIEGTGISPVSAPLNLPGALIIREEEDLIPHDGAADGAPELVLDECAASGRESNCARRDRCFAGIRKHPRETGWFQIS